MRSSVNFPPTLINGLFRWYKFILSINIDPWVTLYIFFIIYDYQDYFYILLIISLFYILLITSLFIIIIILFINNILFYIRRS